MALMRLRYGGYLHPEGECTPTGMQTVRNRVGGAVVSIVKTMSVRIHVIASGESAINRRIAEIEAAYAMDGGDVAFLMTTGEPTHWQINSGSSLSGVQVDGPNWEGLDAKRGDFVSGLSCTIGFKAEYAPLSATDPFTGSSEDIEINGTGQRSGVLTELDNDLPQIDWVRPATGVYVVQSGEAAFELSAFAPDRYPAFNPPLFPGNILDPANDHRQRRGRVLLRRAGLKQCRVAWNYVFSFTEYPFVPNPR